MGFHLFHILAIEIVTAPSIFKRLLPFTLQKKDTILDCRSKRAKFNSQSDFIGGWFKHTQLCKI